MATLDDAYSRYQRLLTGTGKAYPGSSGYWGGFAHRTGQNPTNAVDGINPGDAARARLAVQAGLDPAEVGAGEVGRRYGSVGNLNNYMNSLRDNVNKMYSPVEILKSQMLASGAKDLKAAFDAGSADIPGFDELMKNQGRAMEDITKAYDREQQSYDLTGYSAGQRASDAAAAALTGDYANTSRDIGRRYAESDAEYARRLEDITKRAYAGLGDYDKAADAIGAEQLGKLAGQVSRYKMAGGNLGLGTDELRRIARGVGDIRLPLEREKIQRRYDILTGVELPSSREIATRNAARYAGFDLPLEQNIYGARTGDVLRSKSTEQDLKQLEMLVAQRGMASATELSRRLSAPIEDVMRILNLKTESDAGKARLLLMIGQAENDAYYRGLRDNRGFDFNPMQPTYYPMGLPNRYPGYGGDADFQSRYPGGRNADGAAVLPRFQGAVPSGIYPQPPPTTYSPSYGGGFSVGADGNVTGMGTFKNFDWGANYNPNTGGYDESEQAYYDAVARRYE